MKKLSFLPSTLLLMAAGGLSSAYGDIVPAGQAHYNGNVGLNGRSYIASQVGGTFATKNCFTQPSAFPPFKSCASGSLTMLYGNGGPGEGLVLASGSADPLPVAFGDYTPPSSNAGGQVSFYFVLSGPPGDAELSLHYKLSTAAAGVADAKAEVVAKDQFGNTFVDVTACASTFYVCGTPSTVNAAEEFTVPLSDVGFETFLLFNYAAGYAAPGGSFAASSDPEVTFAPGFDSTGYTLTFSPVPMTVPEPRFLWLLGPALAILLVARRGHPRRPADRITEVR